MGLPKTCICNACGLSDEKLDQVLREIEACGFAVVPDNDWAFMARVTAMEPDKKRKFYAVVRAMFT